MKPLFITLPLLSIIAPEYHRNTAPGCGILRIFRNFNQRYDNLVAVKNRAYQERLE